MLHQLEVTTRCNFDCNYCAGRAMVQKDLSFETFNIILNNISSGEIRLQGEGEPFLWAHFWDAVDIILEKNLSVSVITNGTIINEKLITEKLAKIYISIDTIDQELSTKIGRYNIQKVLNNVDLLLTVMSPSLIHIITVDTGQDLKPLKEWIAKRKLSHNIRPLLQKVDYSKWYPIEWVVTPRKITSPKYCNYLLNNMLSYWTVDGVNLPCCFIKDATDWPGKETVSRLLSEGKDVKWCNGCFNLRNLNVKKL